MTPKSVAGFYIQRSQSTLYPDDSETRTKELFGCTDIYTVGFL